MTEKSEPKPVHKGLYAALAAAQAEMGKASKDTNNTHFNRKYADLASVCDACMPALSRHGIAVLQPAYDDESGRYIKTIFAHGESGETAECRVPLIVSKNDMQGYGSAATYARRYGLMGMAGIAPEDDDGHAAAKSPPMAEPIRREEPKRVTPPSDDDVALSVAYINGAKTPDDLKVRWFKLTDAERSDARLGKAKDDRKAALAPKPDADLDGDYIPYEKEAP